jgi:hypothetical protein
MDVYMFQASASRKDVPFTASLQIPRELETLITDPLFINMHTKVEGCCEPILTGIEELRKDNRKEMSHCDAPVFDAIARICQFALNTDTPIAQARNSLVLAGIMMALMVAPTITTTNAFAQSVLSSSYDKLVEPARKIRDILENPDTDMRLKRIVHSSDGLVMNGEFDLKHYGKEILPQICVSLLYGVAILALDPNELTALHKANYLGPAGKKSQRMNAHKESLNIGPDMPSLSFDEENRTGKYNVYKYGNFFETWLSAWSTAHKGGYSDPVLNPNN